MRMHDWLQSFRKPARTRRSARRHGRHHVEALEQRVMLAATYNVVFDGSFETSFHQYGIVANNPPDIVNQTWQDSNPSLFLDPVGPNTGWALQPTADPSGGSVDVVGENEFFGATLTTDFDGDPVTYSAQHGNDAIDLIGTPYAGALNQVVETQAGVVYELSFWVSSNQENDLDADGGLLEHSDRQLQVYWNGSLVTPTITAPDMGIWEPHTFSVVGTAGTSQLGFLGIVTPGSLATSAGSVEGIPHNAGDPLFGALLDNVSLVSTLDAVDDPTTVLSEDYAFTSYNNNVIGNDIGNLPVDAATVLGRTTNSTALLADPSKVPAGVIFSLNNPNKGDVFWDIPGPDPMSTVADFLAAGEYFEDTIEYSLRSVTAWQQISLSLPDFPNGASDTALWKVRVEGVNDSVIDVNAVVDDIFENEFAILNVTFVDPDLSDTHIATIDWGDGTSDTLSFINGERAFATTHQYLDDDPTATTNDPYLITVTVTDNNGSSASDTAVTTVTNVAPAVGITLLPNVIDEGGTVTLNGSFTDPGTLDTHVVVIDWGDGTSDTLPALALGDRTFSGSHQFPTGTGALSYTVTATVTDDDTGVGTASAIVTINPPEPASISGSVFIDSDQDGLYDANEFGIDGVLIELLDGNGQAILNGAGTPVSTLTSGGGFYLFDGLAPGTYQLRETQPAGLDDGPEYLGSLGGTIVGNDVMQLTLENTDALDYVFTEVGQSVTSGDTATIGFWQNKNGQALIVQGGADLAQWLSTNFGNVFGDSLSGGTGQDVADFYKQQLFKQKASKSTGPAKVDAQFMAVAFATYFTSSDLAEAVATGYGFNVTDTGIGSKIVNVGTNGAAFSVANGTNLTIMQLLVATNNLTDQPNDQSGYASTYDKNGDGIIDAEEAALRSMANEIYTYINEEGDI